MRVGGEGLRVIGSRWSGFGAGVAAGYAASEFVKALRSSHFSVLARRRPAAGAVTMSGVAMTVVLVDDDARYRRVARLALQCEGVSVVAEAADGCEAVRILEHSRADVVLLDIGLPGLSGSEVARRLRAVDGGPVVILISSRGADYGRRVAEGVAAGFIAKDVLCLAAIRDLLDAAP